MISTVTVTIVSIVTNGALAGFFALIGILVLVALLVQKELVSVSERGIKGLDRILNIGITPLLIVFILIVVSRVVEVIR